MQNVEFAGMNFTTNSGGLTAGTTDTQYNVATAIYCCINGQAYQFATKSSQEVPDTDAVTGAAFTAQAANTACVYLFCSNAALAVKVIQGNIVTTTALNTYKDALPQFPAVPNTLVPFGYSVVQNGSTGSSWILGTGQWSATGITHLEVDILTMPDRPQLETTA